MGASRRCQTCGTGLAGDQRYCLACGARDGAASPLLRRLLTRGSSGPPSNPTTSPPSSRRSAPAGAGLRLPSPFVSALLVALFVGFGALLGDAASGPIQLSDSAAPALKLVVPRASHAASPGASAEASSQPPESRAEPTPVVGAPEAGAGSSSSRTQGSASTGRASSEAAKPTGEQTKPNQSAAGTKTAKLSEIEHVFLIVLSDEPYAADFGPESSAHYIARTLAAKGEQLLRYEAIAHEGLPDAIALISGQGPTPQTATGCPTFESLSPGTIGADGQAIGEGCVYPATVQTLPGQLSAKHLRWRAYIQGMDEGGTTGGPCQHPASGAPDTTTSSGTYATANNPFVYFESIVQSPDCEADDVGLNQLAGDLSGSSTPSFSYIVPDRCDDAGPLACAPGAATGPSDADGFLEQVVPEIMRSKAYRHDGLLVITADEAPASGELADSSSCCGQPASYPNLPGPGRHGGGSVGALLLSPLIKGGTFSQEPYNHFSLLRTIEDVFGLEHLGYAALPGEASLSPALLNAPASG